MSRKERNIVFFVLGIFVFSLSGCSTLNKTKRIEALESEVSLLNRQMAKLQKEKDAEIARLTAEQKQRVQEAYQAKERELTELERAKRELEERLKNEIGSYKAKLEMTERGLVITFLSEVFFDSGKDKIRSDGEGALKQVAEVLNADVPDTFVAIEGHTDNQPIKYSGWKSNWELSSARALAVLHYFVDQCQVGPKRLSAVGYGEYRPVTPNETVEGKQKNRRVEIIILPSEIKKTKRGN